jgi:hypothetical protein
VRCASARRRTGAKPGAPAAAALGVVIVVAVPHSCEAHDCERSRTSLRVAAGEERGEKGAFQAGPVGACWPGTRETSARERNASTDARRQCSVSPRRGAAPKSASGLQHSTVHTLRLGSSTPTACAGLASGRRSIWHRFIGRHRRRRRVAGHNALQSGDAFAQLDLLVCRRAAGCLQRGAMYEYTLAGQADTALDALLRGAAHAPAAAASVPPA